MPFRYVGITLAGRPANDRVLGSCGDPSACFFALLRGISAWFCFCCKVLICFAFVAFLRQSDDRATGKGCSKERQKLKKNVVERKKITLLITLNSGEALVEVVHEMI